MHQALYQPRSFRPAVLRRPGPCGRPSRCAAAPAQREAFSVASDGGEDALALVVKLGSDDAALSLLAEVPVGSLLPAEDGVYSPASRLLRLLLLAQYHAWAERVFLDVALWFHELHKDTGKQLLSLKARSDMKSGGPGRAMLYCPINALLAMAEALFGELTVLTVILEAEQRHGTTLDGTIGEYVQQHVARYPTLADRASPVPAAGGVRLRYPDCINAVRNELCFRVVHAAWDGVVECTLAGLFLEPPCGEKLRVSAVGFALAAALPARAERELWAALLAPGGYWELRRAIWRFDGGEAALHGATRAELEEELTHFLRVHVTSLLLPLHVVRWTLTLRETVEECVAAESFTRLSQELKEHASRESQAPVVAEAASASSSGAERDAQGAARALPPAQRKAATMGAGSAAESAAQPGAAALGSEGADLRDVLAAFSAQPGGERPAAETSGGAPDSTHGGGSSGADSRTPKRASHGAAGAASSSGRSLGGLQRPQRSARRLAPRLRAARLGAGQAGSASEGDAIGQLAAGDAAPIATGASCDELDDDGRCLVYGGNRFGDARRVRDAAAADQRAAQEAAAAAAEERESVLQRQGREAMAALSAHSHAIWGAHVRKPDSHAAPIAERPLSRLAAEFEMPLPVGAPVISGAVRVTRHDAVAVCGSGAAGLQQVYEVLTAEARNEGGRSAAGRKRTWLPSPDVPSTATGELPILALRVSQCGSKREVRVRAPDGTSTQLVLPQRALSGALSLLGSSVARLPAFRWQLRSPPPLHGPRPGPRRALRRSGNPLKGREGPSGRLAAAEASTQGAAQPAPAVPPWLRDAAAVVAALWDACARGATVLAAVAARALLAAFALAALLLAARAAGGVALAVERCWPAAAHAASTDAAAERADGVASTSAAEATRAAPAARLLDASGRLTLQEELDLAARVRGNLQREVSLPRYWQRRSGWSLPSLAAGSTAPAAPADVASADDFPLVYTLVVTPEGRVAGVQPMTPPARKFLHLLPLTEQLYDGSTAAAVREFRTEAAARVANGAEPTGTLRRQPHAAPRPAPERFALLEAVVFHGEDSLVTVPAEHVEWSVPWVATRSVELGLPGIQARLPITLPQLESWPQRTRVPWSRERFVSVPTFGVRVTPLEAEPALLALWADKARGGLDVYGSHAAALFAPPEQAAALQRSLAAEIRDFYHMRDSASPARGDVRAMVAQLESRQATLEALLREARPAGADDAHVTTLCDALESVVAWQAVLRDSLQSGALQPVRWTARGGFA